MTVPILTLGDRRLRRVAATVTQIDSPEFRMRCEDLLESLLEFRAAEGYGRALSAPQIGWDARVIAMDTGAGLSCFVNPMATPIGYATRTLWDDCISVPGRVVRVRRNARLALAWMDTGGLAHTLEITEFSIAELVQHEIDHLDGILSIDRAIDADSIVTVEAFKADPSPHLARVDHRAAPGAVRL